MMDRQHGKLVIECDACGEALETGERDFSAALRKLRAAEWRALQLGADWVHTCAGCAEKNARIARARRAGRIP